MLAMAELPVAGRTEYHWRRMMCFLFSRWCSLLRCASMNGPGRCLQTNTGRRPFSTDDAAVSRSAWALPQTHKWTNQWASHTGSFKQIRLAGIYWLGFVLLKVKPAGFFWKGQMWWVLKFSFMGGSKNSNMEAIRNSAECPKVSSGPSCIISCCNFYLLQPTCIQSPKCFLKKYPLAVLKRQ